MGHGYVDSRVQSIWKQAGWTQSDRGGTSIKLTKVGTNTAGYPVKRHLMGISFSTDAVSQLYALNGTAFLKQLTKIPSGAYHWNFPVFPQSDEGTTLSVLLDSDSGGTVSMTIFGH